MDYTEKTKNESRKEAIEYAINILTKDRNTTSIASRDHVDYAHEYVLRRYTEQGISPQDCKENDKEIWKELWSATIGQKSASELKVAYLAGPNPLNDFNLLYDLGVNPHNIWAFESEKDSFETAKKRIRTSRYPFFKIHDWKIENFFESIPQTFDIVYIDACGPLPSASQATLRTIANLFRFGRLSNLGVLITNFSRPDVSKKHAEYEYSQVLARYLIYKDFLEFFPTKYSNPSYNLTEGAEAHGIFDSEFRGLIKKNFDIFYSQFITRLLIDMGAAFAPLTSLANSRMWEFFIQKDPKTLSKIALDEYHNDNYPCELVTLPFSLNYINAIKNTNRIAKCFINELGGHPQNKYSTLEAINSFYYIKHHESLSSYHAQSGHTVCEYRTEPFIKLLNMLSRHFEYPFFCDVPTEELIHYPIMAQYSYPFHANIEKTRRFSYISEGKSTRMFLDIIPFDSCRYIYDWLPTLPIARNTFSSTSHHLVFRYALDALAKHIRFYNTELIYGANVVPVDGGEVCNRIILEPRKYL